MTSKREILIVDGAYVFNSPTVRVDALKLRRLVEDRSGQPIHEAHWFDAVPNPVPEQLIKFHHFLKSAPPLGPQYRLALYPLKSIGCHCTGCGANFDRPVQKGVDVGIATLMVKSSALDLCHHIHLIAGDGDFKDALAFVQESRRVDVTLYGFKNTVSTDLQSWASTVVWLDDYIPQIIRDQ